MARSGPIVLVEDDGEDVDILREALAELSVENEVRAFTSCIECWDYLQTTREMPLLILSDVNLPALSGLDFKRRIDNDPYLRRKSIPFIFYSTSVSQQTVNAAYTDMTVQGFFQKANNFSGIKDSLKRIIEYWKDCKHPNII